MIALLVTCLSVLVSADTVELAPESRQRVALIRELTALSDAELNGRVEATFDGSLSDISSLVDAVFPGSIPGASPKDRDSLRDAWGPNTTEGRRALSRARQFVSATIRRLEEPLAIDMLVERARALLQSGAPESAHLFIHKAIYQAAKHRRLEQLESLRAWVDHPDEATAVMVVSAVGQGRASSFFPDLLLDALDSSSDAVVDEALKWTTNLWDKSRKGDGRERLQRIFEGENEQLRFRTAFVLMHDFRDREAFDYILSQTASDDAERSLTAIHWIGDARNRGRPLTLSILEHLEPHLADPDLDRRRAAVKALTRYSGDEVVPRLISLLGDPILTIRETVRFRLLEPDRGTREWQRTLELLSRAARDDPDREVRAEALAVLRQLEQR